MKAIIIFIVLFLSFNANFVYAQSRFGCWKVEEHCLDIKQSKRKIKRKIVITTTMKNNCKSGVAFQLCHEYRSTRLDTKTWKEILLNETYQECTQFPGGWKKISAQETITIVTRGRPLTGRFSYLYFGSNKSYHKVCHYGQNRIYKKLEMDKPKLSDGQPPDPRGKTWNTWVLCGLRKQNSDIFRDPVKLQCLKLNRFRKDGYLVSGLTSCREILGAIGTEGHFSEHPNYASGPEFLGNGRELCAKFCRDRAAKIRNYTCDPEMIIP